ncbi:hypothetical protein C4K39_5702 [Pseudomonas sessilinigenes]|nr:hypothetical protein C4K39_5702 [Pseudomonas sessilinigenes]
MQYFAGIVISFLVINGSENQLVVGAGLLERVKALSFKPSPLSDMTADFSATIIRLIR